MSNDTAMTPLHRLLLLLPAALLAAALPWPARAALRVVTTTEGLAALAREVAGDRAKVESLSRGVADPHFVDANPMLAVKLRNADLLVDVGLELEVGWLPPLVDQSRNAAIQPGGKRRLTAAAAVSVLDVPSGPVDRSMGDLHPGGQPPLPQRSTARAGGGGRHRRPAGPARPGRRRAPTRPTWRPSAPAEAAKADWDRTAGAAQGTEALQPAPDASATSSTGAASFRRGELEPRPGVPPPPGHLADLVGLASREGVKEIVVETYYDAQSAEVVAAATPAHGGPHPWRRRR